MPEIQAEGLDVSAEEERYLRGAFRRFALPYLVATLAMAGVAVAAVSLVPEDPTDGGSEEIQSLVAEAASLREAISAVREELRDHEEGEAGRLMRLEAGFAALESGGSAETDVVGRLDHAHQRISALEGRLTEIQSARDAAPSPVPDEAPSWSPASPSLP